MIQVHIVADLWYTCWGLFFDKVENFGKYSLTIQVPFPPQPGTKLILRGTMLPLEITVLYWYENPPEEYRIFAPDNLAALGDYKALNLNHAEMLDKNLLEAGWKRW